MFRYARYASTESNPEETPNKPELGDILQSSQSTLFKNINGMKDKERLGQVKGPQRDTTTKVNV